MIGKFSSGAVVGVMLTVALVPTGTYMAINASAAEPAPITAPVRWSERVCDAIESQKDELWTLASINAAARSQIKPNMLSYLDTLRQELDELRTRVHAEGPAPVTNGKHILEETLSVVDTAKRAIAKARVKAEELQVDDTLKASLAEIGEEVRKLRPVYELTERLEGYPELSSAMSQAAACR